MIGYLMACHLLGAKSFPGPMLTYQLNPQEQTSVKFDYNTMFFIYNMHLKMSAKWLPYYLVSASMC